jgi:glyoxylase-like metal-dependent hydrolase (beta-lactamase superfamily II)
MQDSNRPPNLAARGVYYLPWLGSAGEMYLAAVDRFGRRVLDATVLPGHDLNAVEQALRELLDEHDPPPKLRLVS